MLPTLPLTQAGAPYGVVDVPLGRPFFVTGFEEHSRLVEGKWPSNAVATDPGGCPETGGCPKIEGVMGVDTARLLGWEVGKETWLVVFEGDDGDNPEPPQYIAVTIVGIVEPIDPRAEYWMGSADYFRFGDWEGRPVAPIYVRKEPTSTASAGRTPRWSAITDGSCTSFPTSSPQTWCRRRGTT